MDEYNSIVAKYNRLCEVRNDSRFWAENITDATQDITSVLIWQNFYAYLADSNHSFTDTWKESLGEQVDKGLTLTTKDGEQKFDTVKVQNGNVTYIKMTPGILNASSKDGKQVDFISQGIQEEKSNS